MAVPHNTHMSVEEYLQLDSQSMDVRYEYIDGQVYMMSGGTANHSAIAVNLTSLLRGLLRGHTCRVYNSDLRVQVAEERYVYPDVTVSCDERDRGEVELVRSPRVVIEVLSPTTEAYNRGLKFAYYRECATIQEYVLVNTAYPAIEVCRRQKNNWWSFQTYRPGDEVELFSLGVRFSANIVYEDIVFPE